MLPTIGFIAGGLFVLLSDTFLDKMLKNKKNFNFRQWGIFFRLYKYESFSQYIKNFMVLNLPWIVKIVFDLKHKK